MHLKNPYVLFIGDVEDDLAAKVAHGIADWRPNECVGQIKLPGCKANIDLPVLTIESAIEKGAKTLVVGVANRGGGISKSWHETLIKAAECGLDIASGLHQLLSTVPNLNIIAEKNNVLLHEARIPDGPFLIAHAKPRSGRRLLTVGTDCSVGKMYAALAIERAMLHKNISVDFRATGQTGILISGKGVPIDAVVADFISGAIEGLSPANDADHWDIIEGQGSLFHPSFAGVSLGLLHGAQPTDLILCHEPTRTHMRGLPEFSLPTIKHCMEANLNAAKLVNPDVRFAGIALNTAALDDHETSKIIKEFSLDFDLITCDPLKHGVDNLIEFLLQG
jgi:uncharacterized NAD-dependent epimerase/dehydratase family protein